MNSKAEEFLAFLKPYLTKSELLEAGTILYHFGDFNPNEHDLDSPIWVSDRYDEAQAYEFFPGNSPYYSVFEASTDIIMFDINGIKLQEKHWYQGRITHEECNNFLAESLKCLGVEAIVYASREIFIPEPNTLLVLLENTPTKGSTVSMEP